MMAKFIRALKHVRDLGRQSSSWAQDLGFVEGIKEFWQAFRFRHVLTGIAIAAGEKAPFWYGFGFRQCGDRCTFYPIPFNLLFRYTWLIYIWMARPRPFVSVHEAIAIIKAKEAEIFFLKMEIRQLKGDRSPLADSDCRAFRASLEDRVPIHDVLHAIEGVEIVEPIPPAVIKGVTSENMFVKVQPDGDGGFEIQTEVDAETAEEIKRMFSKKQWQQVTRNLDLGSGEFHPDVVPEKPEPTSTDEVIRDDSPKQIARITVGEIDEAAADNSLVQNAYRAPVTPLREVKVSDDVLRLVSQKVSEDKDDDNTPTTSQDCVATPKADDLDHGDDD